MAGVVDVGLLTYNGFRFPPAITANLEVIPVYGSGESTTKYLKYVLTVEFLIHSGVDYVTGSPYSTPIFGPSGTCDPISNTSIQNFVTRLTRPGGTMVFTGKGFPEFLFGINHRDIFFGPKPQVLNLDPVGSNRTLRVVWRCEFHVTVGCLNLNRGILEATSTINWSINEKGRTTRTISGHVEIVNNRRAPLPIASGSAFGSAQKRLDSADLYRENITSDMPVPPGFRRDRQDFELSEDRRFLNFSIVDVELDSRFAFPSGIVDVEASHRIRTSNLIGATIWQVSLSATYHVAPKSNKRRAWDAFIQLVNSRRNEITRGRLPTFPNTAAPENEVNSEAHLILESFEVDDSVYSDRVTYYVSWLAYVSSKSVFLASGLFKEPDDSTWESWRSWNDANNVSTPRGFAGLRHDPNDDSLSTFCEPGYNRFDAGATPHYPIVEPSDVLEDPATEGSYLKYDVETRWLRDSQTNSHYLLKPTQELYTPAPTYPNPNAPTSSYRNDSASNNPPIIQRRSTGQYRIQFVGRALRYGKPVPMPEIDRAHAISSQEIGTPGFRQSAVATSYTGKPIYAAEWTRTYVLDELPVNLVFLLGNTYQPIVS